MRGPETDLFKALGTARIYDLTQPLYDGMPVHPADPPFIFSLYKRHEETINYFEEGFSYSLEIVVTSMHSGTHIDAKSHMAENLRFHGGADVSGSYTSRGYKTYGADEIPIMMLKAVMLDVANANNVDVLPRGYKIGPEDLEKAAEAQGVELKGYEGVLIRTGYGRLFKHPGQYVVDHAGLTLEGAVYITDKLNELKLVGSDNLALDVLPTKSYPVHRHLLVKKGVYLVKNLFLEELSRDKVWEFILVIPPLKIVGATGSLLRVFALTT